MMRIGVKAVGLVAIGMDNWAAAQSILSQQTRYQPDAELVLKKLELLPPNERRRTTTLIKLALQSAQDAQKQCEFDHQNLATVFSCSDGDLDVVDKIISSLCMEGSPVSPTHFHNSVHNAPSGYWSIATKSHSPSTSLSAYDDSFSVGLIEAATQILGGESNVLLVTYELPPPTPLQPFRAIKTAFAVSLYLCDADQTGLQSILEIDVIDDNHNVSSMSDPALETLRLDNPAARSLPLLECFANKTKAKVKIPYLSNTTLQIGISPC